MGKLKFLPVESLCNVHIDNRIMKISKERRKLK